MKEKIVHIFFSGGISAEQFKEIYPLVWKRNKRILRITSIMSAIMGLFFMSYALLTRSGTWIPYLILLCGSVTVCILNKLTESAAGVLPGMILCYGQMILVCIYAGVLSLQQSNYGIPATSIVVFIALLPLSIDDRIVRMFGFMLTESAVYLVISKLFKSPEAFSLDVMNVATFCLIGMVLYGVICTRNIREISQGVRIEKTRQSVISSLATVVEERDEDTGGHIIRVEEYVQALSEKMKKDDKYAHLHAEFYRNVILACPMHDIGKIRIPDAILNKPGKLTAEEYEIMKKHAEYGAEIVHKTMRDVAEKDYYDIAHNIAKYHHERFDGAGYPEGLKGERIPLEARMMALADVYDALISERVYKKPFSKEKAKMIIEEGSGTQFDPDLTVLFLECLN